MTNFEAHEGQDSVIVRGSMNHAIMTPSEFEYWLDNEGYARSPWVHQGGTNLERALIYRPDGSVRSAAMLIHSHAFEEMLA